MTDTDQPQDDGPQDDQEHREGILFSALKAHERHHNLLTASIFEMDRHVRELWERRPETRPRAGDYVVNYHSAVDDRRVANSDWEVLFVLEEHALVLIDRQARTTMESVKWFPLTQIFVSKRFDDEGNSSTDAASYAAASRQSFEDGLSETMEATAEIRRQIAETLDRDQ